MEQKKRSLIQRFHSLRWSHKTIIILGLLIFCSNSLVLTLVCRAATGSLRQEAYEQLQGQLSIALSTVSSSMDDITGLMVNLSTGSLAKFSWADEKSGYDLQTLNGANEALRTLVRASNWVDYAALLRVDSTTYLYSGTVIADSEIRQILLHHYAEAKLLPNASVRFSLLSGCYPDPELNFYCPIYRQYSKTAGDPCVLLVVGVNTKRMHDAIAAEGELNLRILSADGSVLASGDRTEAGTAAERFGDYQNGSGLLRQGDALLAYQQAGNGRWMADGVISQRVLFSDVRRTAMLIAGVVIFFTLLAIAMSAAFCNRLYAPMRDLLSAMERVKGGDMDTRMRDYQEADFQQLSEGLNSMLVSINESIAEIQRQERENTEIRLNALQSQIKPHFLYNTLECIHWQALMAGNAQVSDMVLSLSRYYRLCLSKGQDIVPLSQELEHTKSYVKIQNMRFDDILQVEYNIPKSLLAMPLPKITLQPLVENAIYHGIKPVDDRKGRVVISGAMLENEVLLTVADDGIGMSREEIDHLNETIDVLINDGSYGVKNVHQRLAVRYGRGYGLHYDRNEAGGITVTIRLPKWKPKEGEPCTAS